MTCIKSVITVATLVMFPSNLQPLHLPIAPIIFIYTYFIIFLPSNSMRKDSKFSSSLHSETISSENLNWGNKLNLNSHNSILQCIWSPYVSEWIINEINYEQSGKPSLYTSFIQASDLPTQIIVISKFKSCAHLQIFKSYSIEFLFNETHAKSYLIYDRTHLGLFPVNIRDCRGFSSHSKFHFLIIGIPALRNTHPRPSYCLCCLVQKSFQLHLS